jgi:hypothetical protein
MKRTASWLFALLACIGPPIWAFFAIEADRRSQLATHGWVCGNPMIGMVCLAAIASSLLSLVAAVFGIAALRAIPAPRPGARFAELGLLLLPFVIGGGFVTLVILA